MTDTLHFPCPIDGLQRVGTATNCLGLYRQAFESSTDCQAIYLLDEDNRLRIDEVNPAFEWLLGLARSELLNRCVDELLPTAMSCQVVIDSHSCIASGAPMNAECVLDLAIGRRYFLHSLIPLRDASGRIARFLHIARDISASKRFEQQLQSDKLAFRTLAEHTPDTIARYDRDCLRTYANPAFAQMAGVPAATMLGKKPSHSNSSAEMLAYEAKLLEALHSGEACEHELAWQAANGEWLISQIRIVPERASNGSVVSVLAVGRDITELRRTEQELRIREQEFRTLAENSPDIVVRYDCKGRRVYVNPAYERFYGIPASEIIGIPISKKGPLPVEAAMRYLDAFHEVLRSGQPNEHELTWCCADRYFYIQTRLVPELMANGQVTSVLSVGRDITKLRRAEQALRIREREFRTLAENSPDVIVRFDQQGRRTYINPAYERLYGISRSEVLGSSIVDKSALPIDMATYYHNRIMAVLHSAQPDTMVGTWARSSSEQIIQDIRGVPEFDQNGQVVSVLTIARDISALKATELRLEQAEALAHLGHWQLDYRLGTLQLSAELCRMLGQPRGWTPRPREVFTLITDEDRSRVIAAIEQTLANRIAEFQLDYCIAVDQQRLHLQSHLRIEYDEDGRPKQILGTAQDISELKAYQQRLHNLAFYDTLTGLPNRELFKDRLQQAMTQANRYGRQVAVLIIDLDNFKVINDTLGHSAGDGLLQETAKRLQCAVRNSDTVARLGGDEFVLILNQITPTSDLDKRGSKLLQAVSGIYHVQGRELSTSGSIGIACYPDDADNIDELLQYADSAMNHAKEQGRNNIQRYSPRLTQQTTERLALAASLRHAQRNGELALHYQPQIDLSNGRLIGAEALLRWNSPEHGQVPPDKFIPIAEETGLIVEIGEWVLYSACLCAAAWNHDQRHPPLRVAVNLSPRQFKMNDLLGSIRTVLQVTGCEPGWLELEITEGLLLDNSSFVHETLEQLCAMGLTIAIDDFGTGYSALGYLNRFPLRTLKIDRSFIRDIGHDHNNAELLKAIISMAHTLRLELVAEGVEDQTQEAFLKRYGCHNAQGYLYGKPMPEADFKHLL